MMPRKPTRPAPKTPDLPPDVQPGDLKYPEPPEWDTPAHKAWAAVRYDETHHGRLTFYRIKGRRPTDPAFWVIATLPISSAKRGSGMADRTYAIGLTDGKVYTVGKGPHVEATVTVELAPDNIERLGKYVELFKGGLGDAGQIRDRISTRRAQGQLNRAQGRTYWNW